GFAELSPSGGVGYGTSLPQAKIDIFNNDGALAALLRVRDSASNTALIVSSGTGYTALGRVSAEERLHVGGNIKADYGVIASTVATSSTATLAALSVTGAVSFTNAASTVAFAGGINVSGVTTVSSMTVNNLIDSASVMVSSSCEATSTPTSCTAACPSGKYLRTCFYFCQNGGAPYGTDANSVPPTAAVAYYGTGCGAITVKALCDRVK
ncbi:MAG TPA: hypothetical protein PLL10_08540, partial [Elusimicrobiales bacterium]|nr:hypothetical protein [Elusimicrobiales bacterium]